MAKAYRPAAPFTVAMMLLTPTETKVYGVTQKSYTEGATFFGSFRTFGGTEREKNGVITLEDTATIDTWFRPDIGANCDIKILETGAIYEIIGTPEDIDMRHQYLRFKVRRIGGKP